MNKKCSMKVPFAQRETNVNKCFKRGRAVGYVAGIQKGITEAQGRVQGRANAIVAAERAIIFSKFREIPIERGTNDLRKATLGILRVPNYRAMSEAQTLIELRNRGIRKLLIPRTGR